MIPAQAVERLAAIRERSNNPFSLENDRATIDADRDYLLSLLDATGKKAKHV